MKHLEVIEDSSSEYQRLKLSIGSNAASVERTSFAESVLVAYSVLPMYSIPQSPQKKFFTLFPPSAVFATSEGDPITLTSELLTIKFNVKGEPEIFRQSVQ